jgi:hypothetical protein
MAHVVARTETLASVLRTGHAAVTTAFVARQMRTVGKYATLSLATVTAKLLLPRLCLLRHQEQLLALLAHRLALLRRSRQTLGVVP